jgi:hypothetical protein
VSALAKIIRAAVHDDGATEHALRPDQLNEFIGDGPLGVALAVRLEVAEVANVALAVGGSAVLFVVGVDCMILLALVVQTSFERAVWLTMGTSGGAAVGVVAKGVYVHAALSVGVVASDVP